MEYPEKVKLVIWDLDETFWKGTLSEEGIEAIEHNIALVKELTKRGIVNSICSKNDFDTAKNKLVELGVWDFFIFSKISWLPKGQQVNDIIVSMGLRPVNCVFIDDNNMNVNEVKDTCSGIYAYHPDDILDGILELPCFAGKNDSEFSRLKQYRLLEEKHSDKTESGLSNVDFLRKSGIEIYFEYDYKDNLDRIYELIERTNQLNYTKIRLETEKDREDFLQEMEHYQSSSALIYCRDKYGNYGAVGFYLLQTTTYHGNFLKHFIFSCRTMNMGLESYIYNYLGRPNITVAEPVAYSLDTYGDVNWIAQVESFDTVAQEQSESDKVVILGPCHLLQMSSFLKGSKNFVHYVRNRKIVKFDCPGFFLNDPEAVYNSEFLDRNEVWTKQEFKDFHSCIKSVDRIVLSLDDLLLDHKLIKIENMIFRYQHDNKKYDQFILDVDINDRVGLLDRCIEKVISSTKDDCRIYILDSIYNLNSVPETRFKRLAFTAYLSTLKHSKVEIINMNSILNNTEFNDGVHLSRSGYYYLSQVVKGVQPPPSEFKIDYRNYTSYYSDREIVKRWVEGQIAEVWRKIKIIEKKAKEFVKNSLRNSPFVLSTCQYLYRKIRY